MTILTRAAKGSELDYTEVDQNFTELRDRPTGDVRPKTKGIGTKIDLASPTWPWRDLEGFILPREAGVGSPTLLVFRGGAVREYAFAANDQIDCRFHIPHDYVPDSDLFLHVHWGHNGTNISGSLVVNFAATYAKGHNQADFSAEIAPILSVSTPNIATVPQYRHRIDEIQLSAVSPSATQLDSNDIEVDGLILLNVKTATIPSITGGAAKPFIFYVDLHYQSTGLGTKAKSPDFWT